MHLRIETYEGRHDRLFLDGKPVSLRSATFDVEDLAGLGEALGFTVEGIDYSDSNAVDEPADRPNPREGFSFVTAVVPGKDERGVK